MRRRSLAVAPKLVNRGAVSEESNYVFWKLGCWNAESKAKVNNVTTWPLKRAFWWTGWTHLIVDTVRCSRNNLRFPCGGRCSKRYSNQRRRAWMSFFFSFCILHFFFGWRLQKVELDERVARRWPLFDVYIVKDEDQGKGDGESFCIREYASASEWVSDRRERWYRCENNYDELEKDLTRRPLQTVRENRLRSGYVWTLSGHPRAA